MRLTSATFHFGFYTASFSAKTIMVSGPGIGVTRIAKGNYRPCKTHALRIINSLKNGVKSSEVSDSTSKPKPLKVFCGNDKQESEARDD